MEIRFAEIVLNSAFKASKELVSVMPLLKDNCSDIEYAHIKNVLTEMVSQFGDLYEYIYDKHPELREAVAYKMDKYGRNS